MENYVETKWIYFSTRSYTGKTYIYFVFAKESNFLLGQVKWYASWRKYSFFPTENTVFETKCLKDIAEFMDKLMLERSIKKLTTAL